jgi:hypothetical protein
MTATATTPTLGKDRAIIFSAPMVRALLEGRKTQTRRLVTPGTCTVLGSRVTAKSPAWTGLKLDDAEARTKSPASGGPRPHLAAPWVHPEDEARGMKADAIYRVDPIIEVGDRLWVREAWTHDADSIEALRAAVEDVYCDGSYGPYYRATEPAPETMRWRSPIFMPRWASRLTLVVTEVRLERLGDISEADAAAEGFASGPMGDPMPETDIGGGWTVSSPGGWALAAGHFQILWTELHPEWDGYSSPWVVAVTFTVHHANIDALQPAPVGAGRSV